MHKPLLYSAVTLSIAAAFPAWAVDCNSFLHGKAAQSIPAVQKSRIKEMRTRQTGGRQAITLPIIRALGKSGKRSANVIQRAKINRLLCLLTLR